MFLKQIPQANGRVKLAVYESYRDGRRTRQRTVRPPGYLDELESEHGDLVAWGKSVAAEMTAAKRAADQAVPIEIRPRQRIDKRAENVKSVGRAVALSQYAAPDERGKAIEKAKALVANPGAYTKATSHGAAQYVKNLRLDKETGEVADGSALELDLDAIAEAEKYDGYYLIVTSETGWDDGKVVDAYRELWRIEESFKATKPELETRPVYVWAPKHVEAHFLTCYVALAILRLLQVASGLPCSRIREEVASMTCVNVDANWWVCGHRTDDSDKLVESVGLEELKLKSLRTSDMRAILAKAAKAEIPHGK